MWITHGGVDYVINFTEFLSALPELGIFKDLKGGALDFSFLFDEEGNVRAEFLDEDGAINVDAVFTASSTVFASAVRRMAFNHVIDTYGSFMMQNEMGQTVAHSVTTGRDTEGEFQFNSYVLNNDATQSEYYEGHLVNGISAAFGRSAATGHKKGYIGYEPQETVHYEHLTLADGTVQTFARKIYTFTIFNADSSIETVPSDEPQTRELLSIIEQFRNLEP